MKRILAFLAVLVLSNISTAQVYQSKSLRIEQVSENVFQHISFLKIENYGNFPCNGMIYFNKGEAVVFDTPVDSHSSRELIDWIEKVQKKQLKAVVVTHFHIDCLGGLAAFHAKNIPSYANKLTIELASEKGEVLPRYSFDSEMELTAGNDPILLKYFGKGHTNDNIVAYIPSKNVIFGGCLIKEVGAGKGNLADASPIDWAATVKKIRETWPEIEIVIPGHGKKGSSELLDYTIELF